MRATQRAQDETAWWRDLPAVTTAGVLVSGVVVYGLLATAYDKFYAELGLTPTDVGVQYGRTLAGAAALSVLVVMGLVVLTAVLFAVVCPAMVPGHGRPTRLLHRIPGLSLRPWLVVLAVGLVTVAAGVVGGGTSGVQVATAGALLVVVAMAGLAGHWLRNHSFEPGRNARIGLLVSALLAAAGTWVVLTAWLYTWANNRADDVKDGQWVDPPQFSGLTVFSVRAMPTVIVATSDSEADCGLVARLGLAIEDTPCEGVVSEDPDEPPHTLLYLGTANGVLVIYDAEDQQTLMLPVTQFRAPVINCDASSDPLCRAQ